MRLYRVDHRDEDGVSMGFSWHRRMRDAVAASHDSGQVREVRVVEFRPTKAGILGLLDRFAVHPDNG